MSTKGNLLTSGTGEILFMAAENPVKQSKSDDKTEYTVTLALDPKEKANKVFLPAVTEVNDAKVVTAASYRGKPGTKSYERIAAVLATGKVKVTATSKFKPTIYDSKGNQLEEAPSFYADSKGTAQMIVEPWSGPKGGTINLISIIIHSIENVEGSTIVNGTDRATRLAQLKAAVDAATKG